MKAYIFGLKTINLVMFFMAAALVANSDTQNLDLDDEGIWYFLNGAYGGGAYGNSGLNTGTLAPEVLGPLYGSGLGTGYGMGGYGDASLGTIQACTEHTVDRSNCSNDPGSGPLEWRFIKNLGWRKFTPYGAATKDWWDYKKTIGWPFRQDPRYFY